MRASYPTTDPQDRRVTLSLSRPTHSFVFFVLKNRMSGKSFTIRPCTVVYLVLMALTVTTFLIGQLRIDGLATSLLVLGFALIKGQLIGDYFMSLKGIRGIWRWVVLIWLFLPGGLIATAFYLSS